MRLYRHKANRSGNKTTSSNKTICEDCTPQPEAEPYIFNIVMKIGSIFHLASHKDVSFLPVTPSPHTAGKIQVLQCWWTQVCPAPNIYRHLPSRQLWGRTSVLLLQPAATAASLTYRPLALPVGHKCANPVRWSSTSIYLGVELTALTENTALILCNAPVFLHRIEPLALL